MKVLPVGQAVAVVGRAEVADPGKERELRLSLEVFGDRRPGEVLGLRLPSALLGSDGGFLACCRFFLLVGSIARDALWRGALRQ